MAIVVPILLSYTGAAAAIGTAIGISATAVSAVASLALQVTGINNKINKAASKVFGEDFVMIANIAGAVYGAVSSLGSAAGSVADGVAGAADAASAATSTVDAATAFVNGSDVADDLFNAAGGLASDGLQAISSTSDASSLFATNGLDVADNTFNLAKEAAGGGLASDGIAAVSKTPDVAKSVGIDLLNEGSGLGKDAKAALSEATDAADMSNASRTVAAAPAASAPAAAPAASSPTAAGTNAAGQKAAGEIGKLGGKVPAQKPTVPEPGSFFDKLGKLATSEKGLGAIVQGVGTGITAAANSKSQRDALEFAKKKYHSVSGVRVG